MMMRFDVCRHKEVSMVTARKPYVSATACSEHFCDDEIEKGATKKEEKIVLRRCAHKRKVREKKTV